MIWLSCMLGNKLLRQQITICFGLKAEGGPSQMNFKWGINSKKADGSNFAIDKVEFVKLDEPVTGYNFTVATTVRIM